MLQPARSQQEQSTRLILTAVGGGGESGGRADRSERIRSACLPPSGVRLLAAS